MPVSRFVSRRILSFFQLSPVPIPVSGGGSARICEQNQNFVIICYFFRHPPLQAGKIHV